MAWQIFRSTPPSLDSPDTRDAGMGVLGAVALQVINPKVWMMAVAVASVFAGEGEQASRMLLLSLLFLLTCLPCMTLWALLGVGSARVLRSPRAFVRMNRGLAVLLLVSAWSGVFI